MPPSASIPSGMPAPVTLRSLFELLGGRMDEGLQAGRSAVRAKPSAGHVALVGVGPGDPELLTLRAARLIGQARVLVVDHLVSDGVLELARPGAELIYVGKESGHHTLPQEEINALLVRLGREGRQVVRLKGGDPYIFGRGGEEVEALIEAGISFEVVPVQTAEPAKEPPVPKRPKMKLAGMDGNIFSILGRAARLLRENGQPEQAKEMADRVYQSGDYRQALSIISEYVETELSVKPPARSKKERGDAR